jgi:zinc transporter ZupT
MTSTVIWWRASMFIYGLFGFIMGMIAGAFLNVRLLRNIPKDQWKKREVKMKYGALNWLCGFVGMAVALYIVRLAA